MSPRGLGLVAALLLSASPGCELMPIFETAPTPRCSPGRVIDVACGICNGGVGRKVCGEDGRWLEPDECELNPYDLDDDGFAGPRCFIEDRSCCSALMDCNDDCAECFPGGVERPGNLHDEDCDGIIADRDGDGFDAVADGGEDCDDSRADRNPGHEPVCGFALDHDCDGLVDELEGCGACVPGSLGYHYDVGTFLSRGLFVTGDRAFVAADEGLLVVDVSEPSDPRTDALVALGRARDVFVHEERAYVVTREELAYVVDVSDPESPALVGDPLELPRVRRIFVSDDRALFVGGSGIEVFALGVEESPLSPVATVAEGAASSIFVRSGRAYLGGPERCVGVMDVSGGPSDLTLLGGGEIYGRCDGDAVVATADHVFAASASLSPGLHVIDASGERLEHPGEPVRTGSSRAVFVAAGHAYVAGWDGLYVVDVTTPETPVVLFHRSTALPRAVFVSGEHAYVGTESGLTVVEIECGG